MWQNSGSFEFSLNIVIFFLVQKGIETSLIFFIYFWLQSILLLPVSFLGHSKLPLLFYWRNTLPERISGSIKIWQFYFHAQITAFHSEKSSFFSFPECSKRRRKKSANSPSIWVLLIQLADFLMVFLQKNIGSETMCWSQNHVSPLNWMKQKEGNWNGKKGVFLFKQVFSFSCLCSMSTPKSPVETGVWRKFSSHLLQCWRSLHPVLAKDCAGVRLFGLLLSWNPEQ